MNSIINSRQDVHFNNHSFHECIKNKPLGIALTAIALIGVAYYVLQKLDFGKAKGNYFTTRLDSRLIQREPVCIRLKDAIEASLVRFVFVTGAKGSGKTTLIHQVVTELIKEGYVFYKPTLLDNYTLSNAESQHIERLNTQHPGKVIAFTRIHDSYYSIASFCQSIKDAIPHDVTYLFEYSTKIKEPLSNHLDGAVITVPPLSPAQKNQILKNEDSFLRTGHISVPKSVIDECFSSIPECKQMNLDQIKPLFSRACARAKRDGKETLTSEMVKAIFSEERNDDSLTPNFLVKVEGSYNVLAKDCERIELLNNIAFRHVMLIGNSQLVADALIKSIALDIGQGRIPEISQIYHLKGKDYQDEGLKSEEQLSAFLSNRHERIILFIDDTNAFGSWHLNTMLKVRCIVTTKLQSLDKRFYQIKLAPCNASLTKLLLCSKQIDLEKTHQIRLEDAALDLVIQEAPELPELAVELLDQVIENAKLRGEKTLTRQSVVTSLMKMGKIISKELQAESIL